MKLVLLISVCSVFSAIAVPLEEGHEYILPFSDDESDKIQYVNSEDIVNIDSSDEIRSTNYFIEYYLFTRSNPTTAQRLYMNDEESVRTSYFNPSSPTVVVAHGFLGSHTSEVNPTIRDAYLSIKDANVIVLNWQRIGGEDEEQLAMDTPALGGVLGRFLTFLSETFGASYNNMHLIGFSLGAHLVANAGKELNGQIARITGLDPAGSTWQYRPSRMSATDAVYVEAIHTSKDFGIHIRVGDVDFYPNGGDEQPGCLTSVCSHNRSFRLYAASIIYNHLEGRKCETKLLMDLNLCFGSTLKIGSEDVDEQSFGIYRLATRRIYPF